MLTFVFAVTANGGVIAVNGSHIVAATAKYFSIPVIFLAELHNISANQISNPISICQLKSPSAIYSFSDDKSDTVGLIDPSLDYIPPELVSLYITNV